MKSIPKRIFIAILAIITLMTIPASAMFTEITYDEEPTEIISDMEPGQDIPDLTADEALLVDYLAGEVQYLTVDGYGNFMYDGKVIEFPPSYQCISLLRPEQDAVLTKGLCPEMMTSLSANDAVMRFAPRSAQMTADIRVFRSQISLGTSTGGWYQARMPAFTGEWFTVFCENINNPTPRPSEGHSLNVVDYTDWYGERIRRALWFGFGGPGQDPALGGEGGIIATTRVIGFLNNTQAPGQANPANSSHAQIRRLYELANSSFTPPSNFRVFWIGTHGNSQDLIFGALDEQPSLGSLRIIKTVPSGESSAGFQFDVRRASDGFHIGRFTTNAAGNIYVSDLEPGNYTITEIVPSGWVLNSQNPQTVTVVAGVTGMAAPSGIFHNVRQTGDIIIQKTCNNAAFRTHSMAGARFEIRNASNAVVATLTTNAAGAATAQGLQLGTYTVREISAPTGYLINTTIFNVTLSPTSLEVTVTVPQEPQRGQIRIQKQATEPNFAVHNLGGAVFEIHNATTGALVQTITTNASGLAQSMQLPFGQYTIREITAPYGYTLNTQVFNVTLHPLNTTDLVHWFNIDVPQVPQRGRITVTKQDVQTGNTAQGDATLEGAVFEIRAAENIIRWPDGAVLFREGQLADTITVEGNPASATSRELPLGRYIVTETSRPHGYMRDIAHTNGQFPPQQEWPMPSISPDLSVPLRTHSVTISRPNQTVLLSNPSVTVSNQVIQGRIWVIKYSGEIHGEPQVQQPLEGAIFEVYLASAGSFEAALAIGAAALITTDAEGIAYTPLLPYGTYRVREVYAPGDVTLVPPFFRYLTNDESNHRRVWRNILNNIPFEVRVRIHKADATTGELIPIAGTAFRIFDVTNDRWVEQEASYPSGAMISTFRTNAEGWLQLPQRLHSGVYRLHEQSAPYGYTLNTEPLEFVIHSTAPELSEDEPLVYNVVFENEPVMGVISVEKQGYVLTDAEDTETEHGTVRTPVWEKQGLPGAVFEVRAAEDIVTPDGTLRAAQGEVVDTIITDNNGYASSEPLHLGRYYVVEVNAPHGFVLDPVPMEATLNYKDQYTPLVLSATETVNERQRVSVSLEKWMELLPELTPPFEDVVFGVFTNDDIYCVVGERLRTSDDNEEGHDSGVLSAISSAFRDVGAWFTRLFTAALDDDENIDSGIETEADGCDCDDGDCDCEICLCEAEEANRIAPIISAGELIALITLDGSGMGTLDGFLPFGSYHIRELSTADGYVLPEEIIDFAFTYAGQDVDTVAIAINDGEAISNYLERGSLRVLKTFEGREEPVSGVHFVLTGETVTGMALTIHAETDENGMIHFDDLPIGTWTVTELEGDANRGFILSEPVTVIVETDGESEISINNYKQRGGLRVVKTFEGRDEPVPDVPFLIRGETLVGDVVEIEAVTDENGEIVLKGLPIGEWTAIEVEGEANRGYILSEAVTVTIEADLESEVSIHNYLKRGDIKILKVCSVSGEPLEGAEFGLFTMFEETVETADEHGEPTISIVNTATLITKAVSNEHGIVLFTEIPFGDYFIRELDAPDGYILGSAFYEVIISKDGTVIELTVENTPEDEDEDVPRTGDDGRYRWLSLFVSLAVIAVCGLTLYVLRKRNKGGQGGGDGDETDG